MDTDTGNAKYWHWAESAFSVGITSDRLRLTASICIVLLKCSATRDIQSNTGAFREEITGLPKEGFAVQYAHFDQCRLTRYRHLESYIVIA